MVSKVTCQGQTVLLSKVHYNDQILVRDTQRRRMELTFINPVATELHQGSS